MGLPSLPTGSTSALRWSIPTCSIISAMAMCALRPPLERTGRGGCRSITDGSRSPADLVILATRGGRGGGGLQGCRCPLPWTRACWPGRAASPRLRLNIFPHDYNGLIFAGLIELVGAGAWRVRDVQARLIAR